MKSSLDNLYSREKKNSALPLFLAARAYVLNGLSTRLIFDCKDVGLFFQEGLSHSVRFWGQYEIRASDLFITTLPWLHDRKDFETAAEVICQTQPLKSNAMNQFLICCNTGSEVVHARAAGFEKSFLINQNAFIDTDVFKITESSLEKIFYLVINTRPEKWKRPFFANGIKNLAIIKGRNYRPDDYYDLSSLGPVYINENRLPPRVVAEILNRSYVGGVFSEVEGANFSTVEYLLSGLPVISTASCGGRDVYFTPENHEIVYEPADVAVALTKLINMLRLHKDLSKNIRESALATSKNYLNTLFNHGNKFLCSAGIYNESFERIYHNAFTNKMILYSPP